MPRLATVRLIFIKELRDLLRDRRTVLLILILPIVLYPLFGSLGYLMASSLVSKPAVVGVVGMEHLPGPQEGVPSLLEFDNGSVAYTDLDDTDLLQLDFESLETDPAEALANRKADIVLLVPKGFREAIAADNLDPRPNLEIRIREGDDKAKLAGRRLVSKIRKWEDKLRERRFEKAGLAKDYHKVIDVTDPQSERPAAKKAADEIRDALARAFPFILMMWLVAGAIQPAVDMTAGEKERGTMETLLISPAERSEIVLGKFLATSAFSYASVFWNVVWLTGGGLLGEIFLDYPIINLFGMIGCVIIGIPLAMLFSSICIALGVFAKSTKEGQYYLMPLILASMPLAFWSMAPGMTVGPENFWIPITGAMLVQRNLLSVAGDPIHWGYVVGVLGALSAWTTVGLLFAVRQFHRESVLFRESGPQKPSFWKRLGLVKVASESPPK